MNLLDPLSVFVFPCPKVKVLLLQEFRLMVVYSPSNYLFRFCFYLMTYCYRLIYFPDLHRPSQIKNPMLRQHYKIVSEYWIGLKLTLINFVSNIEIKDFV